ncbi:hypothetical protein ACFODZ_03955 [Marinicella sediminis]|uniref:Uncharacterized protein n=1 Tax=Marinicella sediminis TaxID=1792834 RepID=A0ABV7J909_9GAMM|nr:hypothetical protein [Marinicella sediminis]
MNSSQHISIDQLTINSLHGHVPEAHERKIKNLIDRSMKEFTAVFGQSSEEEQSMNGIVAIDLDVWSDKAVDRQVLSTAFSVREPVDWGPKPRKPVRCGGSKCYTIKLGDFTYTICIDWEGPCGKLSL